MDLLKETETLESKLRLVLQSKSTADQNAVDLVARIRMNYSRLLLDHWKEIELAAVDQALWKHVHYRLIEEYRRKLRKLQQAMNQEQQPPQRKLHQQKHQQCLSLFHQFLLESSGFYHLLLEKLLSKYELRSLVGNMVFNAIDETNQSAEMISAKEQLSPVQAAVFLLCYRILVYLGDLARYRESTSKDNNGFVEARFYYLRASLLQPDNGNPWNQLAVCSVSMGDDLSALYYYYKSLVISNPFPTAMENLKILAKKINKTFDESKTSAQYMHEFKRFHAAIIENDVETVNELVQRLEKSKFPIKEAPIYLTINFCAFHHFQMDDVKRNAILQNLLGMTNQIRLDRDIHSAALGLRIVVGWMLDAQSGVVLSQWSQYESFREALIAALNAICIDVNAETDYQKMMTFAHRSDVDHRGLLPLQAWFQRLNFKDQDYLDDSSLSTSVLSIAVEAVKNPRYRIFSSVQHGQLKFSTESIRAPSPPPIDLTVSSPIEKENLPLPLEDEDFEEEVIVFSGKKTGITPTQSSTKGKLADWQKSSATSSVNAMNPAQLRSPIAPLLVAADTASIWGPSSGNLGIRSPLYDNVAPQQPASVPPRTFDQTVRPPAMPPIHQPLSFMDSSFYPNTQPLNPPMRPPPPSQALMSSPILAPGYGRTSQPSPQPPSIWPSPHAASANMTTNSPRPPFEGHPLSWLTRSSQSSNENYSHFPFQMQDP